MPTREEVLAVARLAGLRFTGEELDRMARELDHILAHIGQLKQIGTVEGEAAPAPGAADIGRGDVTAFAPAPGDAASPSAQSHRPPLRTDTPGPDALLLPPSHFARGWSAGFFTVPRLRTHDRES